MPLVLSSRDVNRRIRKFRILSDQGWASIPAGNHRTAHSGLEGRSLETSPGFDCPQQDGDGISFVVVARAVTTSPDRGDDGGLVGVAAAGDMPLDRADGDALVRNGKVQPMPYSTRPLEAANDVLDELKAGKTRARTSPQRSAASRLQGVLAAGV